MLASRSGSISSDCYFGSPVQFELESGPGGIRTHDLWLLGRSDRAETLSFRPTDWTEFDEYVTNSFAANTWKDYRRYARHYSDVLTTGDASPLLGLTDCKRRHVMGALAALANFSGVKGQWRDIVSRHNLKWSGRNDLGDLVGLLYSNRFDEMVTELKHSLEKVPEDYANYFRFNVVTGLRPNEAVTAANMVRNGEYGNTELGLLEHFRFPKIFIRNTKKAFVSVIDPETLALARATRPLDYQGVRSEFRTFMRRKVDTELVDLLQGRVPTSVFAKHYNRPNQLVELEKVRASLPELRKLI